MVTAEGYSTSIGDDAMENQSNSRMCFVYSIENPIGLKLKFNTDDLGRFPHITVPDHLPRRYPQTTGIPPATVTSGSCQSRGTLTPEQDAH